MPSERMKADRILETALYVRDVAEAVKFYADSLGLELARPATQRNAFFRCGTGILLLFKAEETLKPATIGELPIPTHGTSGPGHVCFAATPEEFSGWIGHLKGQNIAIERELVWPNGARSLYFRDPSGNSLEIAEPKLWD